MTAQALVLQKHCRNRPLRSQHRPGRVCPPSWIHWWRSDQTGWLQRCWPSETHWAREELTPDQCPALPPTGPVCTAHTHRGPDLCTMTNYQQTGKHLLAFTTYVMTHVCVVSYYYSQRAVVISVEERVSGGADCKITAARINQDVQLKHKGI